MIFRNIGKGKTREEAIANAKAGLKLPAGAKEENIHVEMKLPEKEKGFLGLFSKTVEVAEASYDDGRPEKKQKPQKKQQKKNNDKPAQKKQNAQKQDNKKAEPAKTSVPKPEVAEKEKIKEGDVDLDALCAYVKTIVDALKVENAKVEAKIVDGVIEMEIICDDYGIIIGRRGETLDAIQYLASLTVKTDTNKYARVTINVGDYREKRAASLRALAAKHSAFVARTGRRHTFEPMNPYERRIIHTAVQEIDGVTSRSIGNGIDRRVVIEPEGGVKYNDRRSRGNSRSSEPVKKATPAQKPAGIKYGKIEVNKEED